MKKIEVRPAVHEESVYLNEWLNDPEILRWFPMADEREIEDAVRIWMGYTRYNACFTAYYDGVPAGMATLYLQPYQKYAHQCLLAIIVRKDLRNRGIGKALLDHMSDAARKLFNIETLHLEVYQGNPAIRLYERAGFSVYGTQPRFIKLDGEYLDKILMQKDLMHGRS